MMISCGTCGESASIEITPDRTRPGDRTERGSDPRWTVLCAQCGSTWSLTDRLGGGTS